MTEDAAVIREQMDAYAQLAMVPAGVVRVGIDPGLGGAIAVVDDEHVLEVEDMPVVAKAVGKGKQVDAAGLAEILRVARDRHERPMVYLEAVGPMPKQGVTSVFSFGRSSGVVEGVVAALGLSLTRTKPQVWKRQAGLLNRGKDASRGRALDLYPHAAQWLARVRDTGRAEAILIGRFGCGDASQRQLSGGSE